MTKNGKSSLMSLKFCIAGIICFVAAYLSEKTLGAIAAFPFILILPGIAYLIYEKKWHITGFCALAAFLFKCVFSNDIFEIVAFTVFCAIFGLISSLFFAFVKAIAKKSKLNVKNAAAVVFFVIAFVIYIIFYGTIFGNLSSKKTNIEYLEKTYPDEQFLFGSTYYSQKDKRYVTEFGFTAKERYSALVSADKATAADTEAFAPIDGYRDHAKYEILNVGLNEIRNALSTFAYEGSDYVIRNTSVETADILTSFSSFSEYSSCTTYEIALYYQFDNLHSFEEMCRSYIDHLGKYESIKYGSITFYGFDTSDKDDFSYLLTYTYGSDNIAGTNFDSSKYSRYFSEKDTHKYWELLG